MIPCLVIASVNAYNLWTEHWEHWEHMPPLEERVEYPYQNIRTKNFPWGDGDKVSDAYAAPLSIEFFQITWLTDAIVSQAVYLTAHLEALVYKQRSHIDS